MTDNSNEEMMYYFGYGSNLDFDDWSKWCKKRGKNPDGLKEIGPAWIDGYHLVFDYYSNSREGGAANLRAVGSGKAATPGALFEIDKDTLKSLDQKEGVKLPHCYKRIKVTAFTENGEGFECYTYIHYPDSLDYYPPTKEYETLIRDGLIKLSLPVNSLDSALANTINFGIKFFFVYGTLMKNQTRQYAMQSSKLLTEGEISADMYKIGTYPGIVTGKGIVQGELYESKQPFDLVKELDRIEGAEISDPLFNRVIQKVRTKKGDYWSYVYHYANSTKDLELIITGNWKDV